MERKARRDELIPKAASLPVYIWVALFALAAVAWGLWLRVDTRPQVGPLPPLALVRDDGSPVEKAWFREGPTVLLLFLPGEERGDAAARELESMRAAWEPKGVRFLGVSLAAKRGAGGAPVVPGLGYPVVTAQGNVLDALVVDHVPTTLVVDRFARIVARTHGIDGPASLAEALGTVTRPTR